MSVDWQPIATAARTDDESQPMIMLRQDGRRFIGEWDPSAGHWQGLIALDGDFCLRCGAGAMHILERRLECGGGENVIPVSHIISRRRLSALLRKCEPCVS